MLDQRFSVSMCVYGGDDPGWFQTAVNSIWNQTCKPDEVVLVVDGPVPEEMNRKIAAYETNPYFHVIRLETNRGHGNARRIGLDACTHELVAIMDADDISAPDRFEKQLSAFAKDESVDVVGGNITEFTGDPENKIGERIVSCGDTEIKIDMKKRCPMNLVTVMFKKSSVKSVGGFMDWYCEEDYYLWLRMALADKVFANVPDILVNVRVGKETYQRRGGLKYFKSEAKLQKYMWEHRLIGFGAYCMNVSKRFAVQVLLPNRLRGWVFKKFARKTVK